MTRHRCCCRTLLGLSVVLVFGSGCDVGTNRSPPAAKNEWIDPNKIQAGPLLHDALPKELVDRIKIVHATFADVDGTPLDKWMDDFKRDLDPEGNVRIWEDMKLAYDKFINGRDLPLSTKKEIFKVVLFRSMASEQDVLSRIKLDKLTPDDARAIMAGYPSAPKPVDVIQSPR